MKNKHFHRSQPQRKLLLGLLLGACVALNTAAASAHQPKPDSPAATAGGPAATVRAATEAFKSVQAAEDAGYALFHGCVSGPQGGAMGIHYVNGDLVGDGELDAQKPEALLYEPKHGELQLLGVEYLVLADGWHAHHPEPPVLLGQMFNYVGAPNRYGIPAFYELHVWAWQRNPTGMFADWNPRVTCEEYDGTH